jgi:hypothetical protein
MKKWKIFTLISWIFLISLPLFLGQFKSDSQYLFGGLFFNPIDGYSYFAKMQQGYAGDISFQLPYASQTNKDIYIFTFYILLGHISRILGLSIPVIYHIFRIVIAILLFFSLEPLLDKFFSKDDVFYKSAFLTILVGGGMGWIYFLFGDLPIDFWVSEAFVFLSAFSNPHFILTFLILSLLLNLLLSDIFGMKSSVIYFLLGLVLVNISPFAVVVFGFVMILNLLIFKRTLCKKRMAGILSFGVPVASIAAYQYFSIKSDPILNIWNSQNVTTTPVVMNLLFGLSPLLIGSIILLILIFKRKLVISKPAILLIGWILFSIAMSYFPFNLQRRFLVGIYLPLSIAFWHLFSSYSTQLGKTIKKSLPIFILVISVMSNLFIFTGTMNALINQDQVFFIKSDVIQAVDWMDANIEKDSVILATEQTGLVIPALGNFRVVYGHPFESLYAQDTMLLVKQFWKNKLSNKDAIEFINNNNTDFIFCEFSSTVEDCPFVTSNFEIVFLSKNVAIFQVEN